MEKKRGINIVVADDDNDDQFFLEEAFSDLSVPGYRITFFHNGRDIMDYLSVITSPALLPDAMILDLNMPYVDGLTILRRIKSSELLKTIPVYILTTSTSPDHREQCCLAGCTDYFIKPAKMEGLKKIVQKIVIGFYTLNGINFRIFIFKELEFQG
jgi:CheY-like chemotaxis protein